MPSSRLAVVALWFTLFAAPPAVAQNVESMSLEELMSLQVRIATGTPKSLARAPAVASVITAEELEAMGVQDIDEALELVPGLHVSHGSFIYASRYYIRGIVSNFNPHTLVLINGIPKSSLFLGDRGQRPMARAGFPVKMVERIEIIRGPGSAVYGADAFAGVINIITKAPEDLDGGEASLAYGSFDSGYSFLRQALDVGPVQGVFSIAYDQSNGDDPTIEADQQSNLDALLGTSASLAPGPVSMGYRNFDLRTDLLWSQFRLRMAYRQDRVETAQGINDNLDPDSRFEHHHGMADLTWQAPEFHPDWELDTQLSYLYSDFRNPNPINLFPPGADFTLIGGGAFPEGARSTPELSEENARVDVTTLYRGWDDHQLRLGTGYFWGDIFRVTDTTNNQLSPTGAPMPIPTTDISDTERIFLPENQRTSYYGFVQDEWAFAPDWELTAGVRYDHYSDFGDTVNPRLALVWTTSPWLTTKLLYGEAFRAPAFFELHARSNPVALGNPDLEPETIKSTELAFSLTPSENWALDINLYHYRIDDLIDFEGDPGGTFTAQNSGRVRGRGIETELRYQLAATAQLLLNYSYQRTRDQDGEPLGLTPNSDASLRLNWQPKPAWQVTPSVVWVGSSERAAGDARAKLDGYTTLDLNIRRLLSDNVTLNLQARNVFDADVREASRGPVQGQSVPNIPNDLPQQGRSVILQGTVRW
ncbi:TonB-dependent receptor plug domain-containing protein [Marinobacter sp. SS21]|uniref:TonB-dependent receptor plug domain-containing protein n=1 Tax=Marinobacter sp. SS21 TaxID=2979460 RepID=UPI00232D7111|nr:TonB-dependent receptor [Marinobacter sp. SS21]MDC0663645.1 TonB-dependent receptor [Marinobacter sp. SS21]